MTARPRLTAMEVRQPKYKFCPKCSKEKPIREFSLARANKDGHFPYCKQCVSMMRTGIRQVPDLPDEEWRPIRGFKTYFISNKGRVKHRLDAYRENIRIPAKAHNGYLRMVLSENNNRKTISVHREVAIAFIPNPHNYDTVNHIDFNISNNSIENLEWLNCSDNIKYSCKCGRHFKKPVLQMNESGEIIKEWASSYEVQLTLGFFSTLIARCCKGKAKSYKGYIWKYKTI